MSFNNDFNHLKMKLKDIKSATNDFTDKPIGAGGFGLVFKGELLFPDGGKKMVAFKRLDRKHGQGDVEFWKEIMMLSQYQHENLISLLGYCNEDGERILVYEYASRGSLDRYLDKTSLTWNKLLKICYESARGLNHLHDPVAGTQQRVLHRDVKSSNILLDENFTAKISDFGLSKFGPANQQYTYLVSNVVGTHGYCDPMYMETGSLSKESDVYSFGVVLFEVLCGRSCFELTSNGEQNILVHKWKKRYQENGINDIISNHLKEQTEIDICCRDSLKMVANIAYRCLHRDRKERPTMGEVVNELVMALDIQEISGDVEERKEYTELVSIGKHATVAQDTPGISWAMMRELSPITGKGRTELASLLSRGIHVLKGEHRVARNKNGEYYELLSGFMCLPRHLRLSGDWRQFYNFDTRVFFGGKGFPCISISSSNELEAGPRFLSSNVTYNMNLYYRYLDEDNEGVHVPFKYKLHEEEDYYTSCVAHRRGEWLITTLYQFTSYQKEHDFRIEVIGRLRPDHVHQDGVQCEICALFLVGIEFKPVEHEKDENLEVEIKVNMQPNLDTDWERKLPSDYAEIIKLSKDNMKSKTHKELYDLLRSGFLINRNVEKWFSVSKSMKKRHMLPAKVVLEKGSTPNSLSRMQKLTWNPFQKKKLAWKSLPESRFELVAECSKIKEFSIVCELELRLLSLETTYACYLVYKLPTKHSLVSGLIQIDDKIRGESNHKLQLMDLLAPTRIPFIRHNVDEPHDIPTRTRKIKGHPKLRKDGWLEIQIWDFHTGATQEPITMHCHVKSYDQCDFTGLVVQGIEFRPAKVLFASSP